MFKPTSLNTSLLTLLCIFPCTFSWGNLGHRTIAYLAQRHLTVQSNAFVNDILRTEDISDAAIWADEFKSTPNGSYTERWHFINAKDDPPRFCAVDFVRDCGVPPACIVVALPNSTTRAFNDSLTRQDRYEALKMVLHLVGDIHQPFHVEGAFRGGNDIEVYFEGERTNLHFVWDVAMPEKRVRGYSLDLDEKEVAFEWARRLYKARPREHPLLSGEQATLRSGDDKFPFTTIVSEAKAWARESNQLLCSHKLMGDEDVTGKELGGHYYDDNIALLEDRLIKAAERLASTINDNFNDLNNMTENKSRD